MTLNLTRPNRDIKPFTILDFGNVTERYRYHLRRTTANWSERYCRNDTPLFARAIVPLAAVALLLAACSNPANTVVGNNVPLKPAPDLAGAATPGVEIWRSPDLAEYERTANAYMIPPVVVYRGQGADFGALSPEQVDSVAANLTQSVRQSIGRRFKVVNATGPGVFTLALTLVKISPPHAAYIGNGPYDWSAAVVGEPNAQRTEAGVMTVAGKFIDPASGKMLVGFVAPVSPEAMDMTDPSSPAAVMHFVQEASQQFSANLTSAIVRQREINNAPAAD